MVTHIARQSTSGKNVQRVSGAGKQYTDFDFPANQQSLLDTENDNGGLDRSSLAFFKSIVWRRLSDIYLDAEGGMELFKRGI